jgi:hypothetical protein
MSASAVTLGAAGMCVLACIAAVAGRGEMGDLQQVHAVIGHRLQEHAAMADV